MIGDMIRSIYQQKYPNVEIIVVDDGSTDNTRDVIDELRNSEHRPSSIELKYFYQTNAGAPAARNEGIRCATGDCLMFADSDDELTEEGIKAGMDALAKQEIDYVYMRVHEVNTRDGPEKRTLKGSCYDGSDQDLIGHHWHTMAAIYSRQTIERVGFWLEGIPCSQDWEYQIRVKLSGQVGEYINGEIGRWNVHPQPRLGTNHYNSKYVQGVFDVCKSIQSHCQRAGRFTCVIRTRLMHRLIRHALEAGANGDAPLRREILDYCKNLSKKPSERLLIRALRCFDCRITDALAYRTLCSIR